MRYLTYDPWFEPVKVDGPSVVMLCATDAAFIGYVSIGSGQLAMLYYPTWVTLTPGLGDYLKTNRNPFERS